MNTPTDSTTTAKCPFAATFSRNPTEGSTNQEWWPNQLDLKVLQQNPPAIDPMDKDFDYAKEFKSLDFDALRTDLVKLMTSSQDCGPRTMAITVRSSFAWHGTVREPIA